MKSFLYKIILLVLIFAVIDFVSGILLDNLYHNAKSGVAFQENYIAKKSDENVLIFGSSRAAFHYIPAILDSELSVTTYNAGREGTGIYFQYAMLLATLERYKPRVVILDLDFRDYYLRGGDFGPDVYKELLPFYGKINKDFDSLVSSESYDRIFVQSHLYRYNKKFFNVVAGTFGNNNNNFSGYKPLIGEWDRERKILVGEEFNKNDALINATTAFINKAKENDVKVVIVVSPSNKVIPNEFLQYVMSLPRKFNIDVLNYFNDSIFISHPEYFYDEEHLNDKGAKIFTKELAEDLKFIIK